MLQSFSDRIRSSRWLGYGIVIAIAIPFALLGIEAYLGGTSGEVAAEVNGVPIEDAQLQQQVSQRRAQLRERFGGEFPEVLSEGLRERVLDQLILREVLRQAATDAHMRVPNDTLAARIREQEQFRQNGQFNRELYRQLVSRWGLTEQEYEAHVRSAYRVQQLREGITATSFGLSSEGRAQAQLMREERRVGVLEYPRERAAEQVSISSEDVQAYYEDNSDRFQTSPRVRVAYIELSREALAEQVDLTEDELRAAYQSDQESTEESGERQAAHVLFEVPDGASDEEVEAAREEAQRLRERIVDGEADFATMAREHSDDPGSADQGGDLGFVGRDSMVPPFQEALFSLEDEGAISEPVRTSFGFHLIKLIEVRGEDESETESFEQARDQIEREIRRQKAERLFRDRAEMLQNTAYENPGSLQPVAESTGLEVEESDWFSRDEGEGVAAASEVREAAFGADVRDQGVNSDLLDLGNGRVAVLRIADEQAPQQRALETVREEIRDRLREQRIDDLLGDWSESMEARLAEGADAAELADDGAGYRDLGWIRRDGEAPSQVTSAAFSAPPPSGTSSVHRVTSLDSGGRGIVIVRDARMPEVDQAVVDEVRSSLSQRAATAEMSAWADALRAAAEVTRPE
ncbi:MAG: SurA N-terminal domain-containing protein [Halofilum sp. (in: g-proteobacteria)]